VVLPLRAQRRRWKSSPQHAAEYAAIKKMELEAERAQLDFLAANLRAFSGSTVSELSEPSKPASRLRSKNLATLGAYYQLPDDARQRLLTGLDSARVDSASLPGAS
jgi:hypothetical protein